MNVVLGSVEQCNLIEGGIPDSEIFGGKGRLKKCIRLSQVGYFSERTQAVTCVAFNISPGEGEDKDDSPVAQIGEDYVEYAMKLGPPGTSDAP